MASGVTRGLSKKKSWIIQACYVKALRKARKNKIDLQSEINDGKMAEFACTMHCLNDSSSVLQVALKMYHKI